MKESIPMTWVSTELKQMLNRQELGVTGLLTMELAPAGGLLRTSFSAPFGNLGGSK